MELAETLCFRPIWDCFIMSMIYVGSLYVWSSPYNRNQPSIILRRFFSVFFAMCFSPIYLSYHISNEEMVDVPVSQLLGLKMTGLIPALLLPLLLTSILFLGPLVLYGFSWFFRFLNEPYFGLHNIKNLIWLRNLIVAPLSEEFVYRACMMPLLLQCFTPHVAVFICPLFFGSAHLHHMVERIVCGTDYSTAILLSCFEFCYTTLFGIYSAFLFARTGHFAAPFIAHAFCNSIGFPDFSILMSQKGSVKLFYASSFVIGLFGWFTLLFPLTDPSIYDNHLYWRV